MKVHQGDVNHRFSVVADVKWTECMLRALEVGLRSGPAAAVQEQMMVDGRKLSGCFNLPGVLESQ